MAVVAVWSAAAGYAMKYRTAQMATSAFKEIIATVRVMHMFFYNIIVADGRNKVLR